MRAWAVLLVIFALIQYAECMRTDVSLKAVDLEGRNETAIDKRLLVKLAGFQSTILNAVYSQKESYVSGVPTYWSKADLFIFYCGGGGHWMIGKGQDFDDISRLGKCHGLAHTGRALNDIGRLSATQWKEHLDDGWAASTAGVESIDVACSSLESHECGGSLGKGRCMWHFGPSSGWCTAKWQVFTDPPKFDDVNQGELGTCYMLAAMASVAFRHPQLIKAMFVKPERWQYNNPVYTVQWLLTGKPTLVAVDDMIPTSKADKPFFVKYSDSFDMWPILLEKSWAKIFGSFKGVEGGFGPEAFKAMTQAPVDVIRHIGDSVVVYDKGEGAEQCDEACIWNHLLEGHIAKYPMFAASEKDSPNKIAAGHAYAILEVGHTTDGQKAVRMNNPWGSNRYEGAVKNLGGKEEGSFWMLMGEFIDSFEYSAIANVREGYRLTYIPIPKSGRQVDIAFEVDVYDDLPFSVQLEWPNNRLTKKGGCDKLDPRVELSVEKKGQENFTSVKAYRQGLQKWISFSSVRANQKGGRGTYIVVVHADFPLGDWLTEIALNVYAGQPVAIRPVEQQLPMKKPRFVQLAGFTNPALNTIYDERTGIRFGKYETYWSRDGGSYLYYCEKAKRWIASPSYLFRQERQNHMCQGSARAPPGMDIEGKELVQGWDELITARDFVQIPGAGVVGNTYTRGWWHRGSALLESEEASSFNCEQIKQRLQSLNNWEEIARGERDSLFPPEMSSIAEQGETCGDTAQNIQETCDKYNHWKSIPEIMADAAR